MLAKLASTALMKIKIMTYFPKRTKMGRLNLFLVHLLINAKSVSYIDSKNVLI